MAIVGISSRAGSAGLVILQALELNNFKGDIHLVGRSAEPIDGRPVLRSADALPEGVDLAVFTLPAAAVREAIEACARRKVGSAMIFAAGFAEVGDQATQDAVSATARAAGLAVVGPDCLGITNNVDGIWLHMLFARKPSAASSTVSPSSARAAACSATSSAPPTASAFRSATSSRPATRPASKAPISSSSWQTIASPA